MFSNGVLKKRLDFVTIPVAYIFLKVVINNV